MPTLQEFEEQLDAAGVTDSAERRRRISAAWKSGELEAGPGEFGPVSEAPVTIPVPEQWPTARPPTALEVGKSRMVKGGGLFGQGGGILGVGGEPEPEGEAAAAIPSVAQTPFMPQEKKEGAFEPPPAEQPELGLQLPKVGMPSIANLEKKLGELGEAYAAAQKDIKAGFEKERGAIGEWAETEKAAARAQADVMYERDLVARDLEAQRVEKEQKRQAYVDTEMSKVRDAVDMLKTSKIDPYRFYRHPDGSTNYPKSIAAAVAVGLGALGSSLPAQYGGTGGPNVALQIIDKAIDRDISAQRDDIANKRAGVGLQMNLLSQMRAQFIDERQAENAARVVMLETYKMKLEEAAARSGDQRVQAKAAMLLAEADKKEAATLGDMQIAAANQAVLGEKTLYGAKMDRARMKMAENAAAIKAMGPAKGKQLPANAVTKMADFRAGGGILAKVKLDWNQNMKGKFAGGLAKNLPWATEAKKFEDKTRAAAQFIGKKLEGRMTDEDYERILNMFPAPGDSDDRAQAKFKALEDYLEAMEDATVRTYGETGFDISGFSKAQTKPTAGFKVK